MSRRVYLANFDHFAQRAIRLQLASRGHRASGGGTHKQEVDRLSTGMLLSPPRRKGMAVRHHGCACGEHIYNEVPQQT